MKAFLSILLVLSLFNFAEVMAQKNDSISTSTLLMKRKSQIFMAEIETTLGTRKGILYEADSSKIVILDSVYQRVSISLNEMKSLKIFRSNAALYGAKVGFFIPFVPLNIFGATFFLSSGSITNGFTTAIFLISLVGGVASGILFAIVNSSIRHTIIRDTDNFPEKYYKKLRYFKFKTQQNLIKIYPNKARLIYYN